MLHVHSGCGMLISRTAKRPSWCVADDRGLGFEGDGTISAETGGEKGVESCGSCCTQNAKMIQLGLTLPLVLPLRRATVPSAVWPEPSLQGLLVPPTKARQLVAVRECRGDTRWRQRRETRLGTKGLVIGAMSSYVAHISQKSGNFIPDFSLKHIAVNKVRLWTLSISIVSL